jgi:hypothetical protein
MRKISYRQKNQIMAVVAGVLLLLVLGFSIRKTVALVRNNDQLEQQASLLNQAPEQIAQLQARSQQLGQTLAINEEGRALRKELFEQVSILCKQHQVRLESLQESETFIEDQLEVATHTLRLEGSFVNQIRVCNALENHLRGGRVASVTFTTVRDRRTKQTYLSGELCIQGVKQKTDEI